MQNPNTERPIKKSTSDFPSIPSSDDVSTGQNVVNYDQYKKDNFAERIIADNNELPVKFLEEGAKVQKCVARIHNADSSFGTGFLISPSIIITNNHVLPTKEVSATTQIEFNYQIDLHGDQLVPDIYSTNPDDLFYTSPETNLDFTIVRVKNNDGPPGIKWGNLILEEVQISPNQYCNIIQHPGARFKEVALQENHIARIFDSKVRYTTDTEPGSSGSPVFDNNWRLICLHHAGGDQDPQTGNWLNNEGINIANIRADLIGHFQGDSTGQSILAELRLRT
jgi:endonuclease G, mitochondrial